MAEIGEKFGMLTVDSEVIREKGKHNKYWFVCECGTRKLITFFQVKQGKIVSCGCKKFKKYCCRVCGITDPKQFPKRVKSICKKCNQKRVKVRDANPRARARRCATTRKSQEKNPRNFLRTIFNRMRHCDHRGLEISIDLDYLLELWGSQQGICALTGIEMTHVYNNLRSVSVDRIDNSAGYVPDNIQLVCKAINIGRGRASNDDMIKFLDEIVSCRRASQP